MSRLLFTAHYSNIIKKSRTEVDGKIMDLSNAKIVSHSRQCNPWVIKCNDVVIYVAHKKCLNPTCMRSKKQCIGTCENTLLFTTNHNKAKNFKPDSISDEDTFENWCIYTEPPVELQADIHVSNVNTYSDSEASEEERP